MDYKNMLLRINDLEDVILHLITRGKIENEKILKLEEEMKKMKIVLETKVTEVPSKSINIINENNIVKHDNIRHKNVKLENNTPKNINYENSICANIKRENVAHKKDEILQKTVLVACKGKNWNYHNINTWLEEKLNVEYKGQQWKVTCLLNTGQKKVQFSKCEHRQFIWENREAWKKEDIWLWEQTVALTEEEVKSSLLNFAMEQQVIGKKVLIFDKWVEINGEKWVWVDSVGEILKWDIAQLLPKIKCKSESTT